MAFVFDEFHDTIITIGLHRPLALTTIAPYLGSIRDGLSQASNPATHYHPDGSGRLEGAGIYPIRNQEKQGLDFYYSWSRLANDQRARDARFAVHVAFSTQIRAEET